MRKWAIFPNILTKIVLPRKKIKENMCLCHFYAKGMLLETSPPRGPKDPNLQNH
jgi:hypothetical protein